MSPARVGRVLATSTWTLGSATFATLTLSMGFQRPLGPFSSAPIELWAVFFALPCLPLIASALSSSGGDARNTRVLFACLWVGELCFMWIDGHFDVLRWAVMAHTPLTVAHVAQALCWHMAAVTTSALLLAPVVAGNARRLRDALWLVASIWVLRLAFVAAM